MRKWVAGLLLSISVILLTISLYFLMGFFMQERQDNQLQQELQELMQEKEDDPEEDTSDDLEVDAGILALHEENSDCIGWLTIDGTRIDYPVMYRPGDKNYYLHRDFNGEYSANGCLFLAEECVPGDSDNLIIYGHHMRSGKMFGRLVNYKDMKYYEKHPQIQFDTIYEKGIYQIMYVFNAQVYSEGDVTFKYYQFIDPVSEKEFNSDMLEMQKMSLYSTGVTASYGDQLLTLSTCDRTEKNGRFVVVAKRIG